MKTYSQIITCILLCIGCSNTTNKDDAYALINDNFFIYVDSTAYKTGRLIQIPGDSLVTMTKKDIPIEIIPSMRLPERLKKGLAVTLKEDNRTEHMNLISENMEVDISAMNSSQINNKGRFYFFGNKPDKKASFAAGQIQFFYPYVSENEAIIIVSVSDGAKAGHTKCYLFTRNGNAWQYIQQYQLEVW